MFKTLIKLWCLLGFIVCLVLFFKDAQAHDWLSVAILAGLTCVWASDYSKLRWKNVAITTMIDGKVIHVDWFWTHRGAGKVFDKVTEECIRRFREAGLPLNVEDHREKK